MVPVFSCSSGYGLLIYVLDIVSLSLTVQSNNLWKQEKIVHELIKPYLFYGALVVVIRQQSIFVLQQTFELHKQQLNSYIIDRIAIEKECFFKLKDA